MDFVNCKKYLLYNDINLDKSTFDFKYALFWLLNNHIKNPKNNYFINICYTKYDDYVFENIKIIDNKIVKLHTLSDYNSMTVYSPYDTDLFNDINLSLLYQKIYCQKNDIINNNFNNFNNF